MKKLLFILLLLPLLLKSQQLPITPMYVLASQGGGVALIDGLVSCWELDDTGGTVVDSHGTNDGTVENAIANQEGLINRAYLFDGWNDFIRLSDVYSGYDYGTISVWINTDIEGREIQDIFCSSTGGDLGTDMLVVRISTDNKLLLNIGDTGGKLIEGTSNTTIELNTWYLFVWTMSPTGGTVYLNGVEETINYSVGSSSTVAWFSTVSDTQSPFIARTYAGGGYSAQYGGLLDQTAIWERALSASEVEALYNEGNGLPYTEW